MEDVRPHTLSSFSVTFILYFFCFYSLFNILPTRFFEGVFEIDPDEIWLDLCRDQDDAKNYCRVFLKDYVKYSERPVLCLGPEESKLERSVKAAYSVESLWRTLVLAANGTVLEEKRRADPDHASQWTLTCNYGKKSPGTGPVWQISYWIAHSLSREYCLNLGQSFIKTEATDRDILLFLTTLWTRANDIPCSRRTRVALHSVILMASIGGFRPGTLFGFSYSQVRLAVIRDPESTQRKLVAEITIRQNKLKDDVIRTSQKDKVSFSVVPIPCQICCLATLIAAQAIHDNAFKTPFRSFEELLQRPNMEGVDYVQLDWREEMEDRQIFPVSYDIAWPLWHRTLEVAGLREPVRFYATRVGAGLRLNGALTGAVRNYVLSNSTQVYERSYQPRHVAADLTRIAFGERAGNNEELFKLMRDSSLRRDTNAPIYPTKAELESLEERRDMRDLRATYNMLKKDTSSPEAKKEANRVQARIGKLIKELSALIVQKKRREYFQEVDRRRASGLSTADLHVSAINPRTTPHAKSGRAATIIGQILCRNGIEADFGQAENIGRLLVAFLQERDNEIIALRDIESKPNVSPIPLTPVSKPDQRDSSRSTCLLCGKSFAERRTLIRHNRDIHYRDGQFQQPFDCPACSNTFTVTNAAHWSQHVEDVHGKQNAPGAPKNAAMPPLPVLKLDQLDSSKSNCFLCGKGFAHRTNLTRHNREVHHQEGRFQEPFDCPACNKGDGLDHCIIKDAAHWSNHVETVHGAQNAPGLPQTTDCKAGFGRKRAQENKTSKAGDKERKAGGKEKKTGDKGRIAECEGKVAFCLFCRLSFLPGRVFSRHLNGKHSKLFESPFPCPECPQSGDVSLIPDLFGWKCHVSEVHGGDNGALLVDAVSDRISQRDGAKRRWEDEEDDTYGRNAAAAPKATKKQRLDRTTLEDFIDPVLRSVCI
ncbi:hypothetical protein RB596_000215 [Gaeumannomyces avenae]